MSKTAYVYILASKQNGTLYTGVTSNLVRRVLEHKSKKITGFTEKYNINQLVWYTSGSSIKAALELEKKIKNRGRQWKIALIEKTNPDWRDLSIDFIDSSSCDRTQSDTVG